MILAIDVSRSMCATDIPPNRLLAAEAAAASFIESQGSNTQIGIVAFAGFAEIVQAPTTDQEVLLDVIDEPGDRPADGGRQRHPRVDRRHRTRSTRAVAASLRPRATRRTRAPAAGAPRAPMPPAIIVLLTDGASNAGPDPTEAAQQAAARGVRVYTIGFGTDDPGAQNPQCGQQFIGGEPGAGGPDDGGFGGGGGGGGRRWRRRRPGFRRAIDEDTLTAVADATGGTYYPAESADELRPSSRTCRPT